MDSFVVSFISIFTGAFSEVRRGVRDLIVDTRLASRFLRVNARAVILKWRAGIDVMIPFSLS
jgi:hypothetical protein